MRRGYFHGFVVLEVDLLEPGMSEDVFYPAREIAQTIVGIRG
jgi:hypothetical protein